MKMTLFDISYGEKFEFDMENNSMGSDLSLMLGYLENYKRILNDYVNVMDDKKLGQKIVYMAKIREIEKFQKKYRKMIGFINSIEQEENSL